MIDSFPLSFSAIAAVFLPYWSESLLRINLTIFANLVGALLLGMLVGYERTYQGRAAGMRTFGIVCMASCSVVVLAGFPDGWFGGGREPMNSFDSTRLIQGLVTGVGFLGAGLIRQDGHKTSGLTTAAAVWASCAIGIQVGMGLYASAILMAFLCMLCLSGGNSIARRLPARRAYAVSATCAGAARLSQEEIIRSFAGGGYEVDPDSMEVGSSVDKQAWRFIAQDKSGTRPSGLSDIERVLCQMKAVSEFQVSGARS